MQVPPKSELMPVFMSGTHTEITGAILAQLTAKADGKAQIFISAPGFNTVPGFGKYAEGLQKISVAYNEASFGPKISTAIADLMHRYPMLQVLCRDFQFDMPVMCADPWAQGRMKSSTRLLAVALSSEVVSDPDNSHVYGQALDRLNSFVNYIDNKENVFTKISAEQFRQKLKTLGFPKNWDENMHYAKILTNFGLSSDQAQAFRKKYNNIDTVREYFKSDTTFALNSDLLKDMEEIATKSPNILDEKSLRVLSKAFNIYKFGRGCVTDIVNYIYSVMRLKPTTAEEAKDPDIDTRVAAVIDEFNNRLSMLTMSKTEEELSKIDLHPFNIMVGDGEMDDILAYILNEYISILFGMIRTRLIVQLPADEHVLIKYFGTLGGRMTGQPERVTDPYRKAGGALVAYYTAAMSKSHEEMKQ